MNDLQKTGLFVGAALVLGSLALFTGGPSHLRLEQFSDQGEAFYVEFTDPLRAASLEVIDFDEESGTATPFKVQVKDGRWSIPSHYDYPADGEDRLANTAAAVIDIKKDIVQSDRLQDHELLGVIDPIDDSVTTLTGRGQRITLREDSGAMLADFIIGRDVEGKQGFRYVRIPEKKQTYAVKMDIDISTRFADWIETNLLGLSSSDLSRIVIQDYSVDETTGSINSQGRIALSKSDNTWSMDELPEDKELETDKVSTMTTALANITITGVRPKPAGLSRDLRTTEGLTMDLPTQLSLQSKGYFVSQDGRLLSNEGEVTIGTTDGVTYTLRFGEVLIGEGMEVSAGSEDEGASSGDTSDENASGGGGTENRYLFVTAQFDESLLPPRPEAPEGYTPVDPEAEPDPETEPRDPAFITYENDLQTWTETYEAGMAETQRLNDRFAPWYYVISAGDFGNIRLGLADLLKDKPVEIPEEESDVAGPPLPPGS